MEIFQNERQYQRGSVEQPSDKGNHSKVVASQQKHLLVTIRVPSGGVVK